MTDDVWGTGRDMLPVEVAYRLVERSRRLRGRRFEMLPLRGAGAAFTEAQGRRPGDASTPNGLQELISSISTLGVLQPILVEVLPDGGRRVVAGERRLAAARWVAVNLPNNPHGESIPAVVCDGPLSEEERRIWQLIENLAREDLQPGELAAALLYERCAVLTAKLLSCGVPVSAEVAGLDDPVQRFEALDALRRHHRLDQVGAPWPEVLNRLGLQLSADKARKLVAAFRALPTELSAAMDAEEVALHTRQAYLQLHRGRRQAAEDIWAAVRDRHRPDLLARAVNEALEHPSAAPEAVVEAAAAFHDRANAQRAATLRSHSYPAGNKGGGDVTSPLPAEVVEAARQALEGLASRLRAGGRLSRYDAGSLRLKLGELAACLDHADEDLAVPSTM